MDEDDTEDDSEDIMFHSFSSCSPRYIKFEEMKEVSECSVNYSVEFTLPYLRGGSLH